MAQTRDIRRRITSVKNTAQITKAMQMISASKMQRAQEKALYAQPYSQGIYEIVSKIGSVPEYQSVYLRRSAEVKNIALVVIGTSRGFVGSMITNLVVKTHKTAAALKTKYPGVKIKGISIHKTALRILANAGIESSYHFADYHEAPNTTDLTTVFELLIGKFAAAEFDEIHIIYTHFVNTLKQEAVSKILLPLNLEEILAESTPRESQVNGTYIFEPSVNGILDKLLPEYFQSQILASLLESIASEHSARMVAMKNATDNARDLEKDLALQYNRKRQAGITQELIEVINGAIN